MGCYNHCLFKEVLNVPLGQDISTTVPWSIGGQSLTKCKPYNWKYKTKIQPYVPPLKPGLRRMMILHHFASVPMDINQYQYQGQEKQEEDLPWYIKNPSMSPAENASHTTQWIVQILPYHYQT